jgi:DNA-binding NarL/FixJ family response regulator
VIADRSDVFAAGLEAALTKGSDRYIVVGRAIEPADVQSCVVRTEADVVLAGFEPVAHSAEVARRLHPVPVLVFSWSRRKEDVITTIRSGAAGYVLKAGLGGEDLLRALQDVETGRAPFDLGQQSPQPGDRHEPRLGALTRSSDVALTEREHQIVSLIVDGHSNKRMARVLGIAEQTVKNHLRNIMAKSNVSSRLQLCAWAMTIGITPPAELQMKGSEDEVIDLRDSD